MSLLWLLLLINVSVIATPIAIGQPLITEGIFDLSSYSFELDGPVSLNAPWAFYWDVLLPPRSNSGSHSFGLFSLAFRLDAL